MKTRELKAMNDLDLHNKVAELKKELMKINSQIATGTVPKSPGKVKEIRRTVAKILTIQNQKTMKIVSAPKKQEVSGKQKGGNKKE